MIPQLRHRQHTNAAELFRTAEMDDEDAQEAGLRPARDLFFRVVGIADDLFAEDSDPGRSRLIIEAESFGVSHLIFHADSCYRNADRRGRFVDAQRSDYAFISAVAASHPSADEDALRAAYRALLAERERQYRLIRLAFHNRVLRLVLGESFVDEVFLAGRIQDNLRDANVAVQQSASDRFVKLVVREAHRARAEASRGTRRFERR